MRTPRSEATARATARNSPRSFVARRSPLVSVKLVKPDKSTNIKVLGKRIAIISLRTVVLSCAYAKSVQLFALGRNTARF